MISTPGYFDTIVSFVNIVFLLLKFNNINERFFALHDLVSAAKKNKVVEIFFSKMLNKKQVAMTFQ